MILRCLSSFQTILNPRLCYGYGIIQGAISTNCPGTVSFCGVYSPSLLAGYAHLIVREKAIQVLLMLSSTCRSLVVTVILVPPEKDCVAISWLLRTPKLFLVPLAVTPVALDRN